MNEIKSRFFNNQPYVVQTFNDSMITREVFAVGIEFRTITQKVHTIALIKITFE